MSEAHFHQSKIFSIESHSLFGWEHLCTYQYSLFTVANSEIVVIVLADTLLFANMGTFKNFC